MLPVPPADKEILPVVVVKLSAVIPGIIRDSM
jgi:hypothetical protein